MQKPSQCTSLLSQYSDCNWEARKKSMSASFWRLLVFGERILGTFSKPQTGTKNYLVFLKIWKEEQLYFQVNLRQNLSRSPITYKEVSTMKTHPQNHPLFLKSKEKSGSPTSSSYLSSKYCMCRWCSSRMPRMTMTLNYGLWAMTYALCSPFV